ncbi:MAG: PP0621 family protein [Campylobacterota bacterium]|nr:PP0621 family protein [Campylobacterota bacterium]
MILKVLLVVAVIGIVYFMFIKKKPAKVSKEKKSKNEKPQANDMIECATCGVYSELEESILSNSKYYCSRECVEKAK